MNVHSLVPTKENHAISAQIHHNVSDCKGCKRPREEFLVPDLITDVQTYGFFGRNQTSSRFRGVDIPKPALNISAFYIDSPDMYGARWIDSRTNSRPFSDPSLLTYSINNVTYKATYMQKNGSCQPSQTYKWGFAFLILYILIVLLLIWTIGIYLTWLHAYFALESIGRPASAADYKAILDLATAVRKEFIETGQDPSELTSDEIRKHIMIKQKGGAIGPQKSESLVNTALISACYRRAKPALWDGPQKWWMLGLVVVACFTVGLIHSSVGGEPSFVGIWGFSTFIGAFHGILFAMLIGSTRRSRLVIFTSLIALGCVAGLIASAAVT